jgi:hypothetical protein
MIGGDWDYRGNNAPEILDIGIKQSVENRMRRRP